ncbi:hypothetical protein HanRHA438_Chr06g0279771 [Helianthus annuus]|uniref:Uncharacterized protein n=1 Tax=Helianthus annuus TaxID=4232 RepID=A0A251VLM3_HELAN|nr:uncharacterized protein LOC110927304 [Helianthus annuus]KAF5803379.1 hypothetical protein HanXRQr2_Chr06g0270631 [Helianthus annuus]KAJ0741616.1 hypothetical protein HanOQP8_Chr06g0230071 [Helianthus annuus]KAJ0912924.1 hypothetical protein HanRHA438_Chr06g0279771 [Helianthus annuus]KAJ0916397.1 hypothetical protein HanPSC8_Chr06g0261221 [Helianthus annuus]
MERTEPTFVPEWLKSSGGLNTTSHQLTSSLKSDEQGASKPLRNKSLDKDLGRVSDKTTSSYFRRTSISNGSVNLRSYSSFNRNHRDRDLDKDIFEFRNKEKSENRHGNYSDSLGNILPSRFEKDGLRRSRSGVTIKRGESWPRKGASELTLVNKSSHVNGGSLLSGNMKTSFERNFPSLGADEKQVDSDIGRVSPGLSSAIQSLPVGNSTMIGGEGWTSALAEVPVIVSNNGNGSSVQPAQQNSISATTSLTGGRNMAETLTRGPPRTQTAPQLAVGTQRLEELAVKQSRQLIPMTPPMPKALGCDKPKLKIGQSQLITNPRTPRSANVKPDFSKTSNVGKLLVLKSTRERNGILPTAKESLSPTSGSNLQNSPPLEVASVPLSKPGVVVLDKRPSSQAQSRSNFFNLMRKKSMASSNSSSVAPDTREPMVPDTGGSGPAVVQQSSDTKVDVTCNRDAVHVQSGPDVIPYSEEEEARLLRAMGWEETAEEEVLTEEEISSFYQHLLKVKPTSKGAQPKLLMPTSFNSKLDS